MKKENSFLLSLEKYTWKVIGRTPLPRYFGWVGVGVVTVAVMVSIVTGAGSTAGITSERELMVRAVKVGDYETARELYELNHESRSMNQVLGAQSELEGLIYPERRVEEEIKKYEQLLTKYPNNRDLLLHLAKLCQTINSVMCASEYWEQARILDPNNEMFK